MLKKIKNVHTFFFFKKKTISKLFHIHNLLILNVFFNLSLLVTVSVFLKKKTLPFHIYCCCHLLSKSRCLFNSYASSRFQQKAEHSCAEKISLHNLMNIHELIIRYCARCDRSDLIKIRKKKIIETEKRHCKF